MVSEGYTEEELRLRFLEYVERNVASTHLASPEAWAWYPRRLLVKTLVEGPGAATSSTCFARGIGVTVTRARCALLPICDDTERGT